MSKLPVPIDSELVGELFLRRGPDADVGGWVENIVSDYLERTADEGYWSDAYYKHLESKFDEQSFEEEYGRPDEGVHWAPLFLPNGTRIRMDYKKQSYSAVVKFNEIHYENGRYSPSELARKIASGTSRNAWRDLFIKRPTDSEWCLADDLRKKRYV